MILVSSYQAAFRDGHHAVSQAAAESPRPLELAPPQPRHRPDVDAADADPRVPEAIPQPFAALGGNPSLGTKFKWELRQRFIFLVFVSRVQLPIQISPVIGIVAQEGKLADTV